MPHVVSRFVLASILPALCFSPEISTAEGEARNGLESLLDFNRLEASTLELAEQHGFANVSQYFDYSDGVFVPSIANPDIRQIVEESRQSGRSLEEMAPDIRQFIESDSGGKLSSFLRDYQDLLSTSDAVLPGSSDPDYPPWCQYAICLPDWWAQLDAVDGQVDILGQSGNLALTQITNRETIIEMPDGERIRVKTDASGTTVTREFGGGNTYSPDTSIERHQIYVEDAVNTGGDIVEIDGEIIP